MFRIVIIIASVFLLASCGFHIRGKVTPPPALATIHLQTSEPYSDFSKQLVKTFDDNGMKVSLGDDSSLYTLTIYKASLWSPESQMKIQKLTQQSLTYVVTYSLTSNKGITVLPKQDVVVQQRQAVGNHQLNTSSEQSMQASNMRLQAISQLLARLTSGDTMARIKQIENQTTVQKPQTTTNTAAQPTQIKHETIPRTTSAK